MISICYLSGNVVSCSKKAAAVVILLLAPKPVASWAMGSPSCRCVCRRRKERSWRTASGTRAVSVDLARGANGDTDLI